MQRWVDYMRFFLYYKLIGEMMTPVSQACSMGCIVREPIQESDEYEVFSFFN